MVDWQQQCGTPGAVQQDISPLPLHYQLTADSAAGADSGEGDGKQGSTGGAWLPAPQVLRDAADRVTAAVNRRITSGGAAHLPLEAADHDGWLPSYAVANCYANGDAGLGQHSDRTTRLGPLPIIASLSLGATRTFRLHRTQHLDLLGGASNGGDPGSAGSGAGGSGAAAGAGAEASSATTQAPTAAAGAEVVQVDIPLPHNALLTSCGRRPRRPGSTRWEQGLPECALILSAPCMDAAPPPPRLAAPPASLPLRLLRGPDVVVCAAAGP
jgi:hypothetical protein